MPNAFDENDQHCPFVNRDDGRCATHFHVDSLEHAFAHCFGRYKTCPHYLELLVERRVRRLAAAAAAQQHPGAGNDGMDANDADTADADPIAPGRARPARVYIPLRIPRVSGSAGGATAVAA